MIDGCRIEVALVGRGIGDAAAAAADVAIGDSQIVVVRRAAGFSQHPVAKMTVVGLAEALRVGTSDQFVFIGRRRIAIAGQCDIHNGLVATRCLVVRRQEVQTIIIGVRQGSHTRTTLTNIDVDDLGCVLTTRGG